MAKKKPATTTLDARRELLANAEASVLKRYKGALFGRAEKELVLPSVFVSGGSLALDRICAGRNPGGLPIGPRSGRVVHVYGVWSTAKSLLLDEWFRSVIVDHGGLGYRAESEGTCDPHFANAIGLPLDLLELDRPETLEEAIDHFIDWHDSIRTKNETIPILGGLDSLDSSEAERAADKGLSEGGGWRYGGGKSEALGAGLRKIVKRTARFPTSFVILNQTRENPGIMFGQKHQSTGGNPPHFYASLELRLTRSPLGDVRGPYRGTPMSAVLRKRLGFGPTDHGDVVGRWVRATIMKTKLAQTYQRNADFYVDFSRGVHKWGGLLQQMIYEGRILARENNTVQQRLVDPDGVVETLEFKDANEWTEWIAQHPEALTVPVPSPGEQAADFKGDAETVEVEA